MNTGSSAAHKEVIGKTSSILAAAVALIMMFYLFSNKSASFWIEILLAVMLALAVSLIGLRYNLDQPRN